MGDNPMSSHQDGKELATPQCQPSMKLDALLEALERDRLLKPTEVARLLGISRSQTYSERLQRALGAVRILGGVRYRASAVRRAQIEGIQERAMAVVE